MYKIVLADDHALVRRGIKRVIEEDAILRSSAKPATAWNSWNSCRRSSRTWSSVILPCPGSGVWRPARVKKLYPHIKVLILSMHKSKEYLSQAKALGVEGYVLKEDADTALYTAIQEIRRGKTFFSPLLSE